jgi:predicted Zn-dependent protease
MKRWLPLAVILIAGLGAIFVAERSRVDTQPSPQAILSATADAEHELTRVPARFDRMSDEDEIRIGDQIAQSYESSLDSTQKQTPQQREAAQRVLSYVQTVGASVAAHAGRRLPYRFHYIADPNFVNAFALPGGHVFIGEGLLLLMHSEDALAAVLGHEVEHIDLRHCAERTQTEAHLRNLGTLGDLLGLPVDIYMAGYSKQQELDADRGGAALAVAAGYSPRGILQLFTEFQKLEAASQAGEKPPAPQTPVDEAAQLSVQTLQDYFASHPPAAERIQQIATLMRSERWPEPPLRPLLCQSSLEKPSPSRSAHGA